MRNKKQHLPQLVRSSRPCVKPEKPLGTPLVFYKTSRRHRARSRALLFLFLLRDSGLGISGYRGNLFAVGLRCGSHVRHMRVTV